MSIYTSRPWLARYPAGMPADITAEYVTMLDLFHAAVERAGNRPALQYFDGRISYAALDGMTDALAVALLAEGFEEGDRLGLYTQNNPAFVIGMIAAWKAGGAGVAINPMNRHRELEYLLRDSGVRFLLCLDDLYAEIAAEVIAGGTTAVRFVIICSPLDHQQRDDARLFADVQPRTSADAHNLIDLLDQYANRKPPAVFLEADDIALLSYTSGTTGEPKGAMNTHANMTFNSQTYRDWIGLNADDIVLGIAPLFHITGIIGHVGIALLLGAPLVLAYRLQPEVMMDAIREHRPTFTIGAITAFIALASLEGITAEDWSSFRRIYSGGAPIAPAITKQFEERTGHYIHNAYGLTETNSPSHAVPPGMRAPVDSHSGALSVGLPVFNTIVRIIDDDGQELPAGEVGEMATSGPQVVPGYWGKPEATAQELPGGEMHTGDVGFMDDAGWFYVVDRKKDMINAAGYKVWPREVEDVLYGHPEVLEAAVVGVPDSYRGENVKAYVSRKAGSSVDAETLIAYCKDNMAAYKYPRMIVFMDDLPKTATGKILRRELRRQAIDEA